jgi:hypothetical protein
VGLDFGEGRKTILFSSRTSHVSKGKSKVYAFKLRFVYIYPSLSLRHHPPNPTSPYPQDPDTHLPGGIKLLLLRKKSWLVVFSASVCSLYIDRKEVVVEKGFTCYYKAQQMWERSEK